MRRRSLGRLSVIVRAGVATMVRLTVLVVSGVSMHAHSVLNVAEPRLEIEDQIDASTLFVLDAAARLQSPNDRRCHGLCNHIRRDHRARTALRDRDGIRRSSYDAQGRWRCDSLRFD